MSLSLRRLRGAGLAGILGSYAATSWAQVASATVDLSAIQIRLVDLDLADGIAPAMTVAPINAPIRTSYSMYDDGVMAEYDMINDIGTTQLVEPFGAASTSSGADFMRASVNYDGAAPGMHVFGGNNQYGFTFTLTPSTGLIFSGDVVLAASDPGGAVRAGSAADMLAFFMQPPSGQTDFISFRYEQFIQDGSLSESFHGELRSSADPMQGWFNMRASAGVVANDIGPPPPVPEPATYATLAAGLGLLAMRARAGRRA